jgi:hypothetical protein
VSSSFQDNGDMVGSGFLNQLNLVLYGFLDTLQLLNNAPELFQAY